MNIFGHIACKIIDNSSTFDIPWCKALTYECEKVNKPIEAHRDAGIQYVSYD